MVDLQKLTASNQARWQAAKILRQHEFNVEASKLVAPAAKARFQVMEARERVPWSAIAVIKQRESGDDPAWRGNIANGQNWNARTTIVPAGRGPFPPEDPQTLTGGWYAAAHDALANCQPFAARWHDWSAGGLLTLLEQYNGLGYAMKGVPSPYIWAGTDQYVSGKYVADHVYDPDKVDPQLGCAGLLLAMAQLDQSIKIGGAVASGAVVRTGPGRTVPVVPSPSIVPPQGPSITHPAPGSIGAFFASLFRHL